jgi:hypothetical protein
MSKGKLYFSQNSIHITSYIVDIRGVWYDLMKIKSAKKAVTRPKASKYASLVVAMGFSGYLIAVFCDVFGINVGFFLVIGFSLVLGIGVLWHKRIKSTYHLLLFFPAGKKKVLSLQDEGYIDTLVFIIKKAIRDKKWLV